MEMVHKEMWAGRWVGGGYMGAEWLGGWEKIWCGFVGLVRKPLSFLYQACVQYPMWGIFHHCHCTSSIVFAAQPMHKPQEELYRDKPNWEHLKEDLHVLITVDDSENRARLKLERAVEEVKKLLVPPVSWVVGCLDVWMVGWLVCWMVGCMDAWVVGWLGGWLAGWLDVWCGG